MSFYVRIIRVLPSLSAMYVFLTSHRFKFFRSLLLKLSRLPSSPLIIGGDFNIAFSEVVDKLLLPGRQLNPSLKNLSRAFRKLIRHFALFDFWRIVHPRERSYSFFSPPHNSHSHIDNFFGNIPALLRLITADIWSITWSDHVPVSITLDLGNLPTQVCYWHLNESLLKKPQHCQLRKHILFSI